ncbi:MAG TPA: hypothetical protein VK459_08995, partial [Polyangiaceae bacterium]|nr:hypothetical protein [Polyangiaceae bacterium]
MRATIILLALAAGCLPSERAFDEGLGEVTYPDAPVVAVPDEHPVPARLLPGRYTCADACALAAVGACPDLQEYCG